jgi:transposase
VAAPDQVPPPSSPQAPRAQRPAAHEPPPVKAWLFKEQFEHAWTYTTEQGMRDFLVRWRRLLNWSRLTSLIAFYDMLMRHIDGVVSWARHRLTNAALEGNNSRVRAISQRAHGYRNPNNLMLVL